MNFSLFSSETTSGSVISSLQFNKILDYIKSGKEAGAKIVTGGEKVGTKGFFLKPTIFVNVKDDMKIAKEEIFGPVVSIFKFSDAAEVLKRAK